MGRRFVFSNACDFLWIRKNPGTSVTHMDASLCKDLEDKHRTDFCVHFSALSNTVIMFFLLPKSEVQDFAEVQHCFFKWLNQQPSSQYSLECLSSLFWCALPVFLLCMLVEGGVVLWTISTVYSLAFSQATGWLVSSMKLPVSAFSSTGITETGCWVWFFMRCWLLML